MAWSLDSLDGVRLWRPANAPPGAVVAATTRLGGVSEPPYDGLNLGRSTADRPEAVSENRRRVLAAVGLSEDRVATAGQVHGARVVEVREPGLHRDCDALVTRERGLAMAVSGADCLTILYVAPGAAGAAHAGWRGVAAGMPARALEALLELSAAPAADALVYLGPCIGACCYVVGEEVAVQFHETSLHQRLDSVHLDLAHAARRQLEAAGVSPAAILDPPACTACHPEWCFSHRRDRGLTGRQWGLVARLS